MIHLSRDKVIIYIDKILVHWHNTYCRWFVRCRKQINSGLFWNKLIALLQWTKDCVLFWNRFCVNDRVKCPVKRETIDNTCSRSLIWVDELHTSSRHLFAHGEMVHSGSHVTFHIFNGCAFNVKWLNPYFGGWFLVLDVLYKVITTAWGEY